MPENEKKGITVKIDAELHAQVKEFIEVNGMTMAEFVSKALDDELHPKMTQEVNYMGQMRTMAFQVPEELFQQIKDYLNRHNMSQKEFVIGLIKTELERDMAQHNDVAEEQTVTDEDEEESESEDEDIDEDDDEELDDDESEDDDLDDDDESENEEESESEDESMSLEM
jgi:hypothetical protein